MKCLKSGNGSNTFTTSFMMFTSHTITKVNYLNQEYNYVIFNPFFFQLHTDESLLASNI